MKKKIIIVATILFIIGIAVTIGLAFNKNQNAQNPVAKPVTEPIPQLYVCYGEDTVGEISGYTMDMKEEYIRDVIVPVSPDRQVALEVVPGNNEINSISYEIKSIDDKRLIDNGKIENFTQKDGKVSCKFEVSAILKSGEEYFLQMIIGTDKHKEVTYYARIMVEDKKFVKEQVEFAKDFSDKTFDPEKATELVVYLEPDAELLNDDLGKVTIKSSYSMLTWNSLKPEKITDTTVTAKEFCIKDSGEAGTYTLNYQIKATNAQKIEEKYNVSETITVWTFDKKQYVLAYNREINQIWEASENNIGNSFIDLGIQNYSNQEYVESENGQFVAFQINGDVYAMDVLKKQINSVYKLNATNSEQLYQTRAKVIKVDDAGDTQFMIYGYSPNNGHIGKNGISIMEYSNEKNETKEVAFIPCDIPAAVLKEQISQLCYVGDGTLYIMLGNSIYFVNLETKEWGTLVAGMEMGSFAVSEDGTTVAYNTGGQSYSDSITVVDFTSGKKSEIKAENGSKIAVCGYTGANMVYGIGLASDIENFDFFPINKLQIVDKNLGEIKSYSQKKVYITSVEITDTIINIKRWKKGKQIADDQLLDNTEEKVSIAYSSYYNDDAKKKELALAFTNNLDSNLELTVKKPGKVIFDSNVEVDSKFEKNETAKYYVYGFGKLQGAVTDKNEAEKLARDNYGLVTNDKGQKIWVFEENYNE